MKMWKSRRNAGLSALLISVLAMGMAAPISASEIPADETLQTIEYETLTTEETESVPETEESVPETAAVTETESPGEELAEASAPFADDSLDYILGRPMTEEEIALQKAQEPEYLPEITMEALPGVDTVDLDSATFYNEADEPFAVSESELPSSYDARTEGLVTSVKNQLPYGTCWAFSAMAAAESAMIKNNVTLPDGSIAGTDLDLSELQLIYFFYHTVPDELNNTGGDGNYNLTKSYLSQGNHGIFASLYLQTAMGIAEEKTLPYSAADPNLTLADDLATCSNVAYLRNSYWVRMTDLSAVKEMILQLGSVSVSYFHQNSSYNYSTGAYYNTATTSTNHSVNIVGWDDSYAKENFLTQPENDGAWLVKNNWGEQWGDGGYFWISYEELSFTPEVAFAYAYDVRNPEDHDHVYQYDGSGSFVRRKITSGDAVANVFTVSGSEREKLDAVALGTYSTNVIYSLQIYKNPEEGDPESGTPLLSEPQEGVIAYSGYNRIPLEEEVYLDRGDTFSVVFQVYSSDGSQLLLLEDASGINKDWIQFVNDTDVGQSYRRASGTWADLGLNSQGEAAGEAGSSSRIKAYTTDVPIPMESVSVSTSALSLTVGGKKSLTASVLPENTTEDKTVTWTSSDETVAAVSDGTVTAKGVGICTITAQAGSFSAECTVTVGLAEVSMVSAAGAGYQKIKVKWKSVAGAEGYRIYRRVAGKSWAMCGSVTGRSTVTYTDVVPTDTTKYYYVVRAYSRRTGSTVLSPYHTANQVGSKAIPAEPSLVKAVAKTSGNQVTWTAVSCHGYRVYRKVNGGSWQRIAEITDRTITAYLDTSVKKGVTYTYTVRAYYKSGTLRSLSTYNTAGLTVKR